MTRQGQTGQGSKYAVAKEAALPKESKIPFQTLEDESFVEAVEVDFLEDPSCDLITWEAHLEKRKATGHPFEPACKILKELTFIDSSSDEESGPADPKEEADVPAIKAVNKYTGEDEVMVSTADTPIFTSLVLLSNSNPDNSVDKKGSSNPIYATIENTVYKLNESFRRIVHHVKQTSVTTSILWQSLSAVLSNANHEVRAKFGLRVVALLADIVVTNEARRTTILGVGGGSVVDWLLETVAVGKDGGGESACISDFQS
ncbi:hypothetical protein EZV62_005007 [Acer yangbiense]|uniref:Uncharacterized protein n=1 Tax=Acer yangbiense TaxID=1000413 RepID=A0A5C7INK2_9ROSI|nr:hypothetical protein EZV62_005007 [Acer yangbiense]